MTFFLPTILALGQDTTFLNLNWEKVDSYKQATYYEVVQYDQADDNRATETTYFISGQVREQSGFSNYKENRLDGKLKEWYESGQIRKDIDYSDGKLNGRLLTYWDNGNPKRIDTYENGEFIDGKCMTNSGKDTVYYTYQKIPEFPGGEEELIKYIGREIKYPVISRRRGVQGRVVVTFVVNETGTISDIKIDQSVNDELDSEAKRMVQGMPIWQPGMQDGEVVRVLYSLPILFKLN